MLMEAAAFLRAVRKKMQRGELSRQPLRLQHLELNGEGETARCDWVLRANDIWDRDIPQELREHNQTLQAILDALSMRKLLFQTFPDIHSAQVRVFRKVEGSGQAELVMIGMVTREDEPPPKIASLVMRAQLSGFRFLLVDGVLRAMPEAASPM
ncbi:MAG: hypothetical protein P4M01_05725 [Acidobacteriota bacterium]|nr:hypothetical protein [Acidobacteriota bacterium]